jgi:predicted N-acyltransferase
VALTSPRLSVDVAETISAFTPGEWDAVVERAGAPVFYRHAMLLAYEKAPLQAIEGVRYLAIRDAPRSELLAVLPFYLAPRPSTGRGRQLAALTHALHWFETCAPAARADDAILDALWDAFQAASREAGASVIAVANVPDGSPLAEFLQRRGEVLVSVDRAFSLDLSRFASFDEYLASLRRSARKDLLRHSRRASEAGAEVCVEARPESVEEAVEMCRLSGERHDNADWYPRRELISFLCEAASTVHLVFVRLGSRVVSSQICFADSERLYAWATGADYARASSFSPTYPSWRRTVELAFELGVQRISAGRRNEEFKMRFGLEPIDLLGSVLPTRDDRAA